MKRAEDGRAKQKLHCVVKNDGQLTVNINVCRLQSGNEEQFSFPAACSMRCIVEESICRRRIFLSIIFGTKCARNVSINFASSGDHVLPTGIVSSVPAMMCYVARKASFHIFVQPSPSRVVSSWFESIEYLV